MIGIIKQKLFLEKMEKNSKILNSIEPVFIYDGECPFCKYYAELCEIRSKIGNLKIIDARSNIALCNELSHKGFNLSQGAVIIVSGEILYGWKAINWISNKIQASNYMLYFISTIFASSTRARIVYPILLIARSAALSMKGLSTDPTLISK